MGRCAQLLGGWQVNGIVQAQTGFPFTGLRHGTEHPIPDQSSEPRSATPTTAAPRTAAQWFNTACFVRRPLAETGEPGLAHRETAFAGPGFARTDLSFFKDVALPRQQGIQLRVEAFNLWNQTQFRQPGNVIGTPTFGQITTAEDGRIVQVAVKYSF